MNRTLLRLRSYCTSLQLKSALLVLTLLLTSMATQANEGSSFLRDLHEFRINNFMAVSAYYRYSATKDNSADQEIQQAMSRSNANIGRIKINAVNILSPDQIAALDAQYTTFQELMRQNVSDVTEIGYPDLRLVGEMAGTANALSNLSTELYSAARESSQTPTSANVESARSAAVLMAEMLSRYTARSYSQVSQIQGGGAGKPLDEQARDFDALLQQVRAGAARPELSGPLGDIESKWEFIRNSYINYNRNNVVFVIERYSRAILDELDNTVSLLQSQA
ncbi:hypothetical protein [uncultured Marinobacter sp.]|uniref:hypothetical protein n=1 Tax=uncultured Marinobacter sp. TaxID=187379 RepID=UPI0030D92E9D